MKVREGLNLNPIDPRLFLLWLFNKICSSSNELKSILNHSCRGKVKIAKVESKPEASESVTGKVIVKPFWVLTLDLPEFSPFEDGNSVDDLPQINITKLLTKFTKSRSSSTSTVFELTRLPQFLIFHFNRFDRNSDHPVKNRNQTLVEFSSELEILHVKYRLKANVVHVVIKQPSTDGNAFNGDEKAIGLLSCMITKVKNG